MDPAVSKSHPQRSNRPRPQIEDPIFYSYYINACFTPQNEPPSNRKLPEEKLCEALTEMKLKNSWKVLETAFGLILSFEKKEDAEEVFEKMEVAKVLEGPVQVATLPNFQTGGNNKTGENRKHVVGNSTFNLGRFNPNLNQLSHVSPRSYTYQPQPTRLLQPPGPLIIRDVPWSITTEEFKSALQNQGIQVAIERYRQHVRIEVKNIYHYEQLLAEGLNFYNSGRFVVSAERPGSSGSGHSDTGSNGQQDDVLQCYRCQGFWHVAANCRHLPRCVRCGEPHGVEYCTRARGNPVCCNCSGAHHAAYKNCPVRKAMAQAAPVAFVLSRDRPTGSFAEVIANIKCNKPRCML